MTPDARYKELLQIDGLAGNLEPLAQGLVEDLVTIFRGALQCRLKAPRENSRAVDASSLDEDEIRSWFRGLPVGPEEKIELVCAFDRQGVRTRFAYFIEYFDDLWYPARDDVWIIDVMRGWILELSHEEVFVWWAPS